MFWWLLPYNWWRTSATLIKLIFKINPMNLNAQVFIYLDAFVFLLLSGMFFLLFKSNKWFQRSSSLSKKDDWIIYMKYVLLLPVLLGLKASSEADISRIIQFLDICARYRFKKYTSLFAIKDLKLKCVDRDECKAELFIELYYSVFISYKNVAF